MPKINYAQLCKQQISPFALLNGITTYDKSNLSAVSLDLFHLWNSSVQTYLLYIYHIVFAIYNLLKLWIKHSLVEEKPFYFDIFSFLVMISFKPGNLWLYGGLWTGSISIKDIFHFRLLIVITICRFLWILFIKKHCFFPVFFQFRTLKPGIFFAIDPIIRVINIQSCV